MRSRGGGVNILAGGTLNIGRVTAAGDVSVAALGGVQSGRIHAGGFASVMSWASGSFSAAGDKGASACVRGMMVGYVSSSGGSVDVTVRDGGTVNATAAKDVFVASMGWVYANINAGGSATVLAGGNVAGFVTAGVDADVASLGEAMALVSARGDVRVFGNKGVSSPQIGSGDDMWIRSYGDVSISRHAHAGGDIRGLWARGSIAGEFSAGGDMVAGTPNPPGHHGPLRSVSAGGLEVQVDRETCLIADSPPDEPIVLPCEPSTLVI